MAACGTVCSGAHDLPTLTDPAVGSTGDYIGGQYAVFPGLLSVDRCDLFLIHCGQQSSGQGKKTAQEIAIIRKDMYDTYQKLEAEIKEEK